MKLITDPLKAREILINVELLISQCTLPKDLLQLRLIKLWYRLWFANPQTKDLYAAWSPRWNDRLAQANYAFPFPDTTESRKIRVPKPAIQLLIDGEVHQLSEVKIAPVSKKHFHEGTIVQTAQTLSSFPGNRSVGENLVVVTIKGRSDLLLESNRVILKRRLA